MEPSEKSSISGQERGEKEDGEAREQYWIRNYQPAFSLFFALENT